MSFRFGVANINIVQIFENIKKVWKILINIYRDLQVEAAPLKVSAEDPCEEVSVPAPSMRWQVQSSEGWRLQCTILQKTQQGVSVPWDNLFKTWW